MHPRILQTRCTCSHVSTFCWIFCKHFKTRATPLSSILKLCLWRWSRSIMELTRWSAGHYINGHTGCSLNKRLFRLLKAQKGLVGPIDEQRDDPHQYKFKQNKRIHGNQEKEQTLQDKSYDFLRVSEACFPVKPHSSGCVISCKQV